MSPSSASGPAKQSGRDSETPGPPVACGCRKHQALAPPSARIEVRANPRRRVHNSPGDFWHALDPVPKDTSVAARRFVVPCPRSAKECSGVGWLPVIPERQAPRQLRGPDAPRPGQRQSRTDGPHQQRGQSAPPLGPRRRRHASGTPARPLTRLVPGRPATQGHEDRPRGLGPTPGRDRLSDLEAGHGLCHAGPRWRAEVSPVCLLVFGPST